MVNRQGQEFSSFVRLNMTTGYPQYSRTPDGFNEQQAPRIPAEVYGHVFTAQEKANLQDGKAILVSGLKGRGGKEFSTYMKVSPNTGALNFFQENPDKPRNTQRQAAQARQCPNTAAGTEKGGETGGMTRKKRYSNHEQLKTRKIMEQKTDYVFKEEQIDWNALAKVGIGKEQLAQDGNLDLLLQGRETDILPVRLKTAVIDLATDATLRIVENPAGIPVVEINGISSGDK